MELEDFIGTGMGALLGLFLSFFLIVSDIETALTGLNVLEILTPTNIESGINYLLFYIIFIIGSTLIGTVLGMIIDFARIIFKQKRGI